MTEIELQPTAATHADTPKSITRQQLYELVWAEPMLRIGERFGVSSAYLTRVCIELRIPRPPQGYWSMVEFGKKVPPRPALPEAKAGDLQEWSPGHSIGSEIRRSRKTKEPSDTSAGESVSLVKRRGRPPKRDAARTHPLVVGVREHFLKTRASDNGILRPFKRLLPDVMSSEKGLDTALLVAGKLYTELEAKGHDVRIAVPNSDFRRADVRLDGNEKERNGYEYRSAWAPDRPTVAYVGEAVFGLTIFEMTEHIETIYVNGSYLAVRDLSEQQLRRYPQPYHWRSKREEPTGRLCLQVYAASRLMSWKRSWVESQPGRLLPMLTQIVAEVEAAVPEVLEKLEVAKQEAHQRQLKWEEDRRRYQEEEQRRRQEEARKEARKELMAAIDRWNEVQRIEAYFASVEALALQLPGDQKESVKARIDLARDLVGDVNALDALLAWRSPQERLK